MDPEDYRRGHRIRDRKLEADGGFVGGVDPGSGHVGLRAVGLAPRGHRGLLHRRQAAQSCKISCCESLFCCDTCLVSVFDSMLA